MEPKSRLLNTNYCSWEAPQPYLAPYDISELQLAVKGWLILLFHIYYVSLGSRQSE